MQSGFMKIFPMVRWSLSMNNYSEYNHFIFVGVPIKALYFYNLRIYTIIKQMKKNGESL